MITFDSVDHRYITKDKKDYMSVTQLISKYKPDKDWQKIAFYYAKKNGGTAEYWLAQWNKTKTEAAEKGTQYHNMREAHHGSKAAEDKLVCGNTYKSVTNITESRYKVAQSLTLLPGQVYSELILWDDEYEVAGQSDEVYCLPDGSIYINDFKTNKKIDKESFFNRKTGFEYMKNPLHDIQDSNYWHYAIQLSIYAYILERRGYNINKLTIEHVTDDNKFYELPYLKERVHSLLEHYKLEREKKFL